MGLPCSPAVITFCDVRCEAPGGGPLGTRPGAHRLLAWSIYQSGRYPWRGRGGSCLAAGAYAVSGSERRRSAYRPRWRTGSVNGFVNGRCGTW